MKETFIFGNGLGRAIDNDFYSLERVLRESWDKPSLLDQTDKELICRCLDRGLIEGKLEAPTSEDQLSDLQKVLTACDTISNFERADDLDVGWLTDHGKRFPIAIRRYFHDAASSFHNPDMKLPTKFADRLRKFVVDEHANIMTLNYDDLLYECFSETEVFRKHLLRDGFFREFDLETHILMKTSKEGWFLHLHGSPLFANRDGTARKITRAELGSHKGSDSGHLVLTNADSKPSVIVASEVLNAYWEMLNRELRKESKVTLFGYGGGDKHLNRILQNSEGLTRLRIVCRSGETNNQLHWQSVFSKIEPSKIEVVELENILDFDFS